MQKILDGQPAFYEKLFSPFFQNQVPIEEKATCSNCAMCESSCGSTVNSVDGIDRFFRPDTKCCTYHPSLPNYLVGALFSDPSPDLEEGRKRLREKIRNRTGVTPLGISAPTKFDYLYKSTREFFGKARSLRCPYYNEEAGGLCTIWRYREAVCSTYFCKYVTGSDGLKFWKSMKGYLALTEIQLSRYSILEIDPDFLIDERQPVESSGRALSLEDLEDRPTPDAIYSKYWGEWLGREEEFFKKCYEAVLKLSADEFKNLLGIDGDVSLRILEKSHHKSVDPTLPNKLKLNPDATIQWQPDGSVALGAYSGLDAIALPGEAYSLIKEFNGRDTVGETRERLRRNLRSDLSEEILLTLYRQRILTEA